MSRLFYYVLPRLFTSGRGAPKRTRNEFCCGAVILSPYICVEGTKFSTMPLPYCVYVLFSQKDHLLYVGYTSNLEKRLEYHQQGKTKSTANRGPLILIFCEFYLFKQDALKRESYFKKTAGKKALRLMLASTFRQLRYKENPAIVSLPKENSGSERSERGPNE